MSLSCESDAKVGESVQVKLEVEVGDPTCIDLIISGEVIVTDIQIDVDVGACIYIDVSFSEEG